MEILWWLAPAGATTLVALGWATWASRPGRADRTERAARSEQAYEKFAAALNKEHPGAGLPKVATARDRSTGIAVRPPSRDVI